jgi:hypothetical protein
MKAGESSYFSSASLGSGFGAALCPEARANALNKNRPVTKLVLNILKPFKLNKGHSGPQAARPSNFQLEADDK